MILGIPRSDALAANEAPNAIAPTRYSLLPSSILSDDGSPFDSQ